MAFQPEITILGQGLAGSLLAWEFWRSGIPFKIVDPGVSRSASLVGAGIMNPVTGQRLSPSWRWEEHLPLALEVYRYLEAALGVPLVRPFRIHRFLRDERERRILRDKHEAGILGPHVSQVSDSGFWIEGAWRLDSGSLVERSRLFFLAQGVLEERFGEWDEADLVIACTGASLPPGLAFCTPSEGAVMTVEAPELDPGVILNRGHWLLPTPRAALLGSTYWDVDTSPGARAQRLREMLDSAEVLLGRSVPTLGVSTGFRVTSPDKHPIAGWLRPGRLGVVNALGAKGALHAPALAQAWACHLLKRVSFPSFFDLGRMETTK